MKRLTLLIAVVLSVTTCIYAKKEKVLLPMNEFVTELMGKMTVKEKIGQLNLLPSGDIQTGISENSSVSEAIRNGGLGAILNLKGVDNIRDIQSKKSVVMRKKLPGLIKISKTGKLRNDRIPFIRARSVKNIYYGIR